ncbi:hypothetical protein BGZ76_007330 [Entomortierella beljakovae]|nr:hypothetical protein BGZ76_007330 [Entomortierella beljakovae]
MNAQSLPLEILEHVGFYLFGESRSQIVNCAIVCRTWHTAFMRTLYYRIDSVHSLNTSLHGRYPTGETLVKYSPLIHFLNLRGHFPYSLLSLGNEAELEDLSESQQRCRLYSLMIIHPSIQTVDPDALSALVGYHTSTLTDIQITFSKSDTGLPFPALTNFWSNIGKCTSLDHLVVKYGSIAVDEAVAFWEACSRPRTLELYNMSLAGAEDAELPDDGKSLKWPRIERLSLGSVQVKSAISILIRFITRCSNLKSLSWRDENIYGGAIKLFAECLEANIWPLLNSIDFRDVTTIDDNEIARVLSAIKSPQTLELFRSSRSGFSTKSLKTMQDRGIFNTIKDLNLNRCQNIRSSEIQDILSSCPLLEVFLARRISISYIVLGNPWVCTRMKYLCINISTQGSEQDYDFKEKQQVVYQQLAIMKKIEKLDISNGESYTKPGPTLQLRLDAGLGELSGLSRLREFWCRGEQWMGKEDVEWIVKNFPSLRNFSGSMHMDKDIRKEYNKMLESRGVNVFADAFGVLYEPVGGPR